MIVFETNQFECTIIFPNEKKKKKKRKTIVKMSTYCEVEIEFLLFRRQLFISDQKNDLKSRMLLFFFSFIFCEKPIRFNFSAHRVEL